MSILLYDYMIICVERDSQDGRWGGIEGLPMASWYFSYLELKRASTFRLVLGGFNFFYSRICNPGTLSCAE